MSGREDDKAVKAFFEGLAESALRASDAEIRGESGPHPSGRAESLRARLLGDVKAHRQRKLADAWAAHWAAIGQLNREVKPLPATPEGRRALLERVLARFPREGRSLTLQHREFESLTDEDVKSCLKQLQALGALDDTGK